VWLLLSTAWSSLTRECLHMSCWDPSGVYGKTMANLDCILNQQT
jgi:hypothetical protein